MTPDAFVHARCRPLGIHSKPGIITATPQGPGSLASRTPCNAKLQTRGHAAFVCLSKGPPPRPQQRSLTLPREPVRGHAWATGAADARRQGPLQTPPNHKRRSPLRSPSRRCMHDSHARTSTMTRNIHTHSTALILMARTLGCGARRHVHVDVRSLTHTAPMWARQTLLSAGGGGGGGAPRFETLGCVHELVPVAVLT